MKMNFDLNFEALFSLFYLSDWKADTSNSGTFFEKRFFVFPSFPSSNLFARENEEKEHKDQSSEQHTVFTLLKAEMRQTFYRHTREHAKKNPGDFSVLTYLMSPLCIWVQK